MLSRAHRITRPDDFRAAIRRGRRAGGDLMVTHVRPTEASQPVRFGFVVSKAVGVAVVRNKVRRRMRAAAYEFSPLSVTGVDVVFRALPASAVADWPAIRSGVEAGLRRAKVLDEQVLVPSGVQP